MRYWQNIYTNWIESEYLFDIMNGPYDDVFVFDKYALVIKDGNKVNAVYFDQYRGKLVPGNLEQTLNDDYEDLGAQIVKATAWDQNGNGDYQLLVAVRTSGSLIIHPFLSVVEY